ncbi:MAG: hypothetical protein J5940_05555 [Clostridia bacterium]|nr:hypothetical protein [Clostridia bacterium]
MATFYNQATLTYSGGTVSSNVTSGELLEVLTVTKTAVVEEYTQGSDITYAVNIKNSGSIAYTGLTLTDDLGAYQFGETTLQPLDCVDGSVKYFVDGVLQPAPAVTAGPPLAIGGISVPAGSTATVLYTATANDYAPMSEAASITNTVTVGGGGVSDISASATVTAASNPVLEIAKSVSPASVAENGTITYTFVISNTGNAAADATDDVVVTDTFAPVLCNISVTYNGEAWASPANYSYDEASGVFSTASGGITVPAATYTQDPATGMWASEPGTATLTVTGTI